MEAIDKTLYGEVGAALIPYNLNEQGFIAFGHHVKGGTFSLPYLKAPASDPTKWDDEAKEPVMSGGQPVDPDYLPPYRRAPGLLDLHPNVMQENMQVSFKQGFERIEVVLTRNPSFILDGEITEDNWRLYWTITNRFIPDGAQILEFAEEYDGSIAGWPTPGRPPYDSGTGEYPEGAEFDALWETIQYTERHRWYRIKFVDYDEENNPVVGRISPPIPIGQDSTTFVIEVFKYRRQGLKDTDNPADVIPATPPPFDSQGRPNNNPAGWENTPPSSPSTQYLWRIRGLRELKGEINTQVGWSRPALVNEDNETTRYSATGKPNPEVIVPQNADVADDDNEADLVAAGWVPSLDYDPTIHNYIATRTGSSLNWTVWKVERITPQETDITKRVYKLFPRLVDYDDPLWVNEHRPVGSDPSNQRWLREIQPETSFMVNFVSEAVFYADNTIKQDWSAPVPFTSQLTYQDYISIHPDDSDAIDATREIDDTIIRRLTGGVETRDPEKLWLRAQLFLGNNDVLAGEEIEATYQWYKIFDDGEFLTVPEDLGTNRDIQVLHSDITGRAIFRVEVTIEDADGFNDIQSAIDEGVIDGPPLFVEEISIKDQVDGRDGRTLSAHPTQPYFIRAGEGSGVVLLPNTIIIRAEVDNAIKANVEWYYLDGDDPTTDTWVEITATTNSDSSAPKHLYKNANNDLVLVGGEEITATDIFDLVGNDVYFKAEIPAVGILPVLQDWVMVSRREQADLAAGESAFDVHVENPFHLVRVDGLKDPIEGQLDDIDSRIEVRKGSSVRPWDDYTIDVVSVSGVFTDTNGVLIGNDAGNKRIITIDEDLIGWDNTKEKGFVVLDVTLGTETKRVYIGIGTTVEPEGFTGLNIISDRATFNFDYSPGGRNDIELTALLTRHTEDGNEPVAGFNYEWVVVQGRYKGVGAGNVISDVDAVDEVLTVSHEDLDGSAVYGCYAYLTKTGSSYNAPFYYDEVRINDVPDNSTKLLFNNNDHTNQPPLPVNHFDSYPNNTAGLNSWYKVETSNSKWYAQSHDGGTTWRGPFKINPASGVAIPGEDGEDGQDGADGANGGLYSWEGTETIPFNTSITGARVHVLGKVQTTELGGLWVAIYHTNLQNTARVAVGTTTGNAVELGLFNGSSGQTQWRIFWCPVENIPSSTTDLRLYIWSSTLQSGTLRKIIVHAAPTGMKGEDGLSVISATVISGQIVLGMSDFSVITVGGRVQFEPEFRVTSTHIQTKYKHQSAGFWANVVALSTITGLQGPKGVTDGVSKQLFSHYRNLGGVAIPNENAAFNVFVGGVIDTGNTSNKLLKIDCSAAVYNDADDFLVLKVLPVTSFISAGNNFVHAQIMSDSFRIRGIANGVSSGAPAQYSITDYYFTNRRYIQLYVSKNQQGSAGSLRLISAFMEVSILDSANLQLSTGIKTLI